MTADRARRARGTTLLLWLALILSVACWPLGGTGLALTSLAGLPLLLPLPGLATGRQRTLRRAPLMLAPALTIALMEVLANPGARTSATVTLALALAAFAAVIAALRAGSRV